jgi:hypothetical protein
MVNKICGECGAVFQTCRIKSKFCSTKCCRRNWARQDYNKNKQYYLDKHKKYRAKEITKEKIKNQKLEYRYGISRQDFYLLLEKQNSECSICGKKIEINSILGNKACVDHNHKTKENRGILCSRCNIGLGMFQDNPELLEKSKKYLEKFT